MQYRGTSLYWGTSLIVVQEYLAHKKPPPPPRTTIGASASTPVLMQYRGTSLYRGLVFRPRAPDLHPRRGEPLCGLDTHSLYLSLTHTHTHTHTHNLSLPLILSLTLSLWGLFFFLLCGRLAIYFCA